MEYDTFSGQIEFYCGAETKQPLAANCSLLCEKLDLAAASARHHLATIDPPLATMSLFRAASSPIIDPQIARLCKKNQTTIISMSLGSGLKSARLLLFARS